MDQRSKKLLIFSNPPTRAQLAARPISSTSKATEASSEYTLDWGQWEEVKDLTPWLHTLPTIIAGNEFNHLVQVKDFVDVDDDLISFNFDGERVATKQESNKRRKTQEQPHGSILPPPTAKSLISQSEPRAQIDSHEFSKLSLSPVPYDPPFQTQPQTQSQSAQASGLVVPFPHSAPSLSPSIPIGFPPSTSHCQSNTHSIDGTSIVELPTWCFTLTELSSLSSLPLLLKNQPKGAPAPTTTLLGYILEIGIPKPSTVKQAMRGSFMIADSDVTVKINLWDHLAVSWCEALRVGDIVCLRHMTISSYKGQTTASASNVSQVQICFRIVGDGDEDADESFRPDLRAANWDRRTRMVRDLVQVARLSLGLESFG